MEIVLPAKETRKYRALPPREPIDRDYNGTPLTLGIVSLPANTSPDKLYQ